MFENCFFIKSSVSTAVDSSTWTTSIEGMMSINQRKRQEQRIINLDSVSTTGREKQKVWSTLSTSEENLIEVSESSIMTEKEKKRKKIRIKFHT